MTGTDTATCEQRLLARDEWRARALAHEERLDPYLRPHLARRESRVKHPVHDFLFTYYSWRPAQLRRWHPGAGVGLADAEEYAGLKGYTAVGGGAAVDPAYVAGQRRLVVDVLALLRAAAGRTPHFGCFGLHEWAMVYRLSADQVRHADWPLRLGPEGTDAVVENHRIACSHFDAYRFFTPAARPLNTLSPGPRDRASYEQPGCLHATMDLYKHSYRLSPMVGSDLIADCFELAWDVRTLDMRAAPYDLRDLGLEPLPIETPAGKQEYAAAQRSFAERAAPLRRALIEACESLLASSDPSERSTR